MNTEKRSEVRQKAKSCYHAEIRLVGVLVYEVKLKDRSTKGSCILVNGDSLLINHLKTGQNVRVKYFLEEKIRSVNFLMQQSGTLGWSAKANSKDTIWSV